MVGSEPGRLLMPEAADVDLQLNIVDDGRQGVQSNQSNSLLVSHQSFAGFSMDVQRRREYEAELEQANGPHGAAAMALTALSSGMNAALSTEPDVDITSKASSNVPQRNPNIALETVASLAMTEGTILTSGESPAFPLPTVVARTTYIEHEAHVISLNKGPRLSTRASSDIVMIDRERMENVTVELTGSIHPKQYIIHNTADYAPPLSPTSSCETPFDPPTISQRLTMHAPRERTQTLSHLLKDQLSLASMGSEQGWERGHKSVDERSFLEYGDEEANRSFVDDNRSQSYPEQRFYRQSISSPNLRLLEEESQVPKEKYSQRSMPEHLPQATEPQHLSRQYDGPYTPKGPQSFSPLECYSTSSLVEPATGKSKRKYNKKSSRSLSMLENPSQVGSHIVQESELLQSDRGLILKTQIPKKGRPISKHSSASQSTPTFSSFGVLPASHPYFSSKTGMSPTSSLFVMTPSVRPSDPQRAPLTAYPSNIDHLPLPATTTDGSQPHNPTRRGPGRPPLSSTVGGHTHSQSHSSLQSESFTVSNSQPRPARFSPRDSHPHGRPPPPNRISSPFLSTEYFKQKSQHIGHSYTNFQGQEQPQLPGPQHRMAASQYEYEHASEDQQFQTIRHGETLPSPEQRSFAEGIPIPTSNRKRDSYGAEKRRFPDDHYHLEDERKSTVSMHDTDEHRDELNKEQFESTRGRRSNKRLSISEIDYVGLEVDSRDGRENVQRWLGYGPGQHRPRPRSMVLPHGISGSSLQSLFQCATLRTTGTATNSGLHYHASDIDDGEETRLYERKLRDSARYIHHDTTRRPLHGHTRSLDLFNRSCFPLDSHIHRSADHSLEHHSISRRQFGPSDGSDIHIYSRSNSPPAFPVSSHHDYSSAPSSAHYYFSGSVDSRGYPQEPPTATRADKLAREMSAEGSGGNRSRIGTTSTQIKASDKRLSRRGPGPYLKKHQILQQQLQQMQREQEEIEVKMAVQQQRQRQQQQRYSHESSGRSRQHQHSRHISMDQEFHTQRYQHQPQPGRPPKQRVLMRSESASSAIHGLEYPFDPKTQNYSQVLSQQQQQHFTSPSPQPQQQPTQSKRRQNHHQPILLRPVSLPSLTDSGSSSLYCTKPPPGQPLYRSLHAPHLVSPSSLVSVASNASTGTNVSTSTDSTLHTAGGGGSGGTGRGRARSLTDYEILSQAPSPTINSPAISQSTTPPSGGLSIHSPHYSQHDLHAYSSSQQVYALHRSSQQKGSGGGAMSRSNSRSGGMSNSSNSSTLMQSSSQQSMHRHSASLPAIQYSPLPQQHEADPTWPSTHRFAGNMDVTAKKLPPTSSLSAIQLHSCHNATLPPLSSESSLMNTTGDDEPVQGLLIRTPPHDI